MTRTTRTLRILFVTSDKYSPCRPAARTVFAEELVKRGHVVDWIIQAETGCTKSYASSYGNGRAYVAATDDGQSRWRRARKHALDSLNDLRIFSLVRRNRYDLVQVKDKYLAALLAILAVGVSRTRFVYWLAYPHAEAALYSVKRKTARYPLLTFLRGVLLKFLLYQVILRAANHIFVQSEQMKVDIAAQGIPLGKMTAVPSAVNIARIPYYGSLGVM